MSDQGEKACPLCAEEMDLTDQQLKPCKCGYEICVWCWNHIMDMAEKDDTEGRCPACRIPYNKEKIVGMSANCRRLVGDTSMEKKKPHKAKTRTAEDRTQLSSVRVVQRHLVYIVGLPLSLGDENLLLRKEYFGQYGKVLKVSMSRTSGGTVQQFANNTCSVYIKYSNEEEAARCIQSVHGFTLEGNSLRACFGTTKYCHAWLRNAPCTNPDCLYLHEIGSQEDSFAKDESISAYSRVQQITGVTNDLQWRSGNVLPPPADDYCNNNSATSGKPDAKNPLNIIVSSARVSPPTRSVGRTGALPSTASWGTRASNCQSSAGSLVCSTGPSKQNHDACGAPKAFSAAVTGVTMSSVQTTDLGRKIILNDDSHPKELKNKPKLLANAKQHATILQTNLSEDSHTPLVAAAAPMATRRQPSPPITLDNNNKMHSVDDLLDIMGTEDGMIATDHQNHKVCPDITSINIDKKCTRQTSEVARPNGLSLDCFLVRGYQGLQSNDAKLQEHIVSHVGKAAMFVDGASASRTDMQSSRLLNLPSEKEDNFDIQRLSDPIDTSQTSLFSSSRSFDVLDHLRSPSHQYSVAAGAINHIVDLAVNKQDEEYVATITSNPPVASNESKDTQVLCNSGIGCSCVLPDGLHGIQVGTSDNQAVNIDYPGMDVMESSIISNILSLDLDDWDDTLTSQDLVKLLGENERQRNTFNLCNSRRAQNSNESRFSFARQEENFHSSNPALVATREPYLDKLGNGFGVLQHNAEHYDSVGSNQSVFSTNKLPVSRAQISAPPGFSVHSRIPPPGFSPHGTSDQTLNVKLGNHYLESTSSFRNPYEASCVNSSSVADIEFIDTAILVVDTGRPPSSLSNSTVDMRPTFSSQTSAFESEPRLQSVMQRSLQPHQNHRYTDVRDNYSPSDAYVSSSRLLEPSQNGSLSSFSQFARQPISVMSDDHLDTWPRGMAGNNMGVSELLRNNQPSFNKLYGGYEDSKFQISGSGAMFNRTFGL